MKKLLQLMQPRPKHSGIKTKYFYFRTMIKYVYRYKKQDFYQYDNVEFETTLN